MINEAFGWTWIVLGFIAGAGLGVGFDRAEFLGGYGSLRRRMLRLGHIALIMLGVLNILFALAVDRLALSDAMVSAASVSMIAGAVLMPAACVATAWNRKSKPAFVLPVLALLAGGSITAAGLWLGVLS